MDLAMKWITLSSNIEHLYNYVWYIYITMYEYVYLVIQRSEFSEHKISTGYTPTYIYIQGGPFNLSNIFRGFKGRSKQDQHI